MPSEPKYSSYQLAIFDNVKSGTGNTVINALAGSGKTTTLIKSLEYVDPKLSTLMVAFNKKIAEVLKERAPEHVEVYTLHALGLKAISKAFPGIRVDDYKMYPILDKLLVNKSFDTKEVIGPLKKTVSLAKGFLLSDPADIEQIIEDYDISWDEEIYEKEEFINDVLFALKLAKQNTNVIDFDDMLWFTEVYNMKLPQYDRVFVDEAQDLNKVQRLMVIKSIKPASIKSKKALPGRCFVTCDRYQSIYRFRGADEFSVENFIKELQATQFDLPISYRCPLKVIQEAREYVPNIQAAPNAKEGVVEYITLKDMALKAKPGNFILSRLNKPLVCLVLNFLKRKIPARIQGRDVANNLLNILSKCKSKKIKPVLEFIDKWEKDEIDRLEKKKQDTEVAQDKAACLRLFAQGCNNITELKSSISNLFVDKSSDDFVILSSIHKAKGLESNIVYLLEDTLRTFSQEERNIGYVGVTRAKEKLFYVNFSKGVADLP